MLTELSTVKSRLALTVTDYDALLTNAILAISARFDHETNRTLAHTADFTQEFGPADTEISAACYPIESVSKFETKSSETDGWVEQTGVGHLIRSACIISLASPLDTRLSTPATSIGRVTYAGGYLLPGATPEPGQTPLPDDLQQATVEQVACWFQNRDKLGIKTSWPSGGTYQQLFSFDLLPAVAAVLHTHHRYQL